MPIVDEKSYEELKEVTIEFARRINQAIEYLEQDSVDSAYNALETLLGR